MSIQYTEKSTNYSPITTAGSNIKTPFGIEDILLINNNNNNNIVHNANKNNSLSEKGFVKNPVKINEAEEFKKILSSER